MSLNDKSDRTNNSRIAKTTERESKPYILKRKMSEGHPCQRIILYVENCASLPADVLKGIHFMIN